MHAPLAATVLEIFGVVGVIVLLVLAAGVAFFAYQFVRLRRAVAMAMRTMPEMIERLEEAGRRSGEPDAFDAAMRAATARADALARRRAADRDAFLAAGTWTRERWQTDGDRVLFVAGDSEMEDVLARLDVELSDDEADRLTAATNAREAFAAWAAGRGDLGLERLAHLESATPTDAYLIRRR